MVRCPGVEGRSGEKQRTDIFTFFGTERKLITAKNDTEQKHGSEDWGAA